MKGRIKRILIIDDNDIDAYITNRVIADNYGHIKTKIFNSPLEALLFLNNLNGKKSAFASEFVPQLILLDINMPQMDGFQLLDQLIMNECFVANPIPIYMLSSSCASADIETALSKKLCNGYIKKPLDKIKLENIIKSNQDERIHEMNLPKQNKKVM